MRRQTAMTLASRRAYEHVLRTARGPSLTQTANICKYNSAPKTLTKFNA